MNAFGVRLRDERKKRGLTQGDVAEQLGFSGPAAYSNYEQGKGEPNIETLSKLADLFGVTVDYLLGRDLPNEKQTYAEPTPPPIPG